MQGKGFGPAFTGTTRIDTQLKSMGYRSIGNACGNHSNSQWMKGNCGP